MTNEYTTWELMKLLWNWKEWDIDDPFVFNEKENIFYIANTFAVMLVRDMEGDGLVTIHESSIPQIFINLLICKRLERKLKNRKTIHV